MRLHPALVAALLVGCGHTPPPTGADLERWTGPWQPGPPTQLFPDPVSVLNLSADGSGLLIRRSGHGAAPPPTRTRRDTSESFLGFLPATGGSGVWDYSDDRPSQFDSLNNITTAAYRPGGLLVQEETGPIGHDIQRLDYPVFWHAALYLLDPFDPGNRRKLLDLFDEIGGHAVVPDGTLNWFFAIQWAGEHRFVGEGGHLLVKPMEPIARLGLFAGTIGTDTTVVERIDDLVGVDRWSVTADGQVLLQSGHHLALLPFSGGARQSLAIIPGGPERVVMASRCDRATCWAISGDGSPEPEAWEVWRIDRSDGEVAMVRTVAASPPGTPLLPPTGNAVLVLFQGIPYRLDGVLPTP